MSVVRAFFRPGWVALTLVVIAFAVGCFLVLAPWQLGKNTNTQHQIDQLQRAQATPTATLNSLGATPFVAGNEWREVDLTGTYLPDKQALVRLRSINDSPAYEVLAAFRTDAATYLVNRGFVRPVDSAPLPPIATPPAGKVDIAARIRMPEAMVPGRAARIEAGALQVYSIDPASIGAAMDTPLSPGYLQLVGGSPGALGEIPLPQIDPGPYLSYGLQWLAFGVMAPLGLGYLVYSEIRHRRADKERKAAAAAGEPICNAGFTPPQTRRARRRELNDRLTASSSDGLGGTIVTGTIGHGDAGARDKLTDRYGR